MAESEPTGALVLVLHRLAAMETSRRVVMVAFVLGSLQVPASAGSLLEKLGQSGQRRAAQSDFKKFVAARPALKEYNDRALQDAEYGKAKGVATAYLVGGAANLALFAAGVALHLHDPNLGHAFISQSHGIVPSLVVLGAANWPLKGVYRGLKANKILKDTTGDTVKEAARLGQTDPKMAIPEEKLKQWYEAGIITQDDYRKALNGGKKDKSAEAAK